VNILKHTTTQFYTVKPLSIIIIIIIIIIIPLDIMGQEEFPFPD